VKESPFGSAVEDLVARTGRREAEIAAAACPGLIPVSNWFVDRAWLEQSRGRLVQMVHEYHASHPLTPGIARQDLRSRLMPEAPPFLLDAVLAGAREIVVEGETVRLSSHRVVLREEESAARAAIERAFAQAGLATPPLPEVLARSGVEPARARSLLQILLREKILVRVSEDLVFHRSAIDQLRQMMAGKKSTRFNVAAFKDWTGVSRKYAIPLLEYLDRERITRRDGEHRLVL
jgi:selenocysteine-specific elongation factor